MPFVPPTSLSIIVILVSVTGFSCPADARDVASVATRAKSFLSGEGVRGSGSGLHLDGCPASSIFSV